MRKVLDVSRFSRLVPLVVAIVAVQAGAGSYPSNECASDKLRAAAGRCDLVLKAWSIGNMTGRTPQWLIDHSDRVFDAKWARAEDEAALENVDCADMTLSGEEMKALMDGAIDEIVAEVNDGLNLRSKRQAWCGSKILASAAAMCRRLLHAESRHVDDLSRDPDGIRLDAMQERAELLFGRRWDWATRRACPTNATEEEIAGLVGELNDDVVTNTTVSPNVPDDAFMAITHPGGGEPGNEVSYEEDTLVPQCQDGSEFTFFVKRGSVNKLLMYYYGGGACWDTLTCVIPTCNQTVSPNPPGLSGSGFADLNDPENPFKDWHVVHVPYCGCDVHWGDAGVDYLNVSDPGIVAKHVEHRGHDNAKLVEKWVREHFLNPTDIFSTGSSAGSYGAIMHGVHLSSVYPASSVNVMGDGGNGVITQEFLENRFINWGVEQNLPDVPGIGDVPTSEQSMPDIIIAAASYYPRTNWANYTTAFDGGGGGQTGFYNVMLNPDNPIVARLFWEEASCQFNQVMREQAFETADAIALENDNYRYYIASGTRHTGFGNPRVYYDTTGGVPPLVDWVNAMIDDDPSWTNVEADPFNVLFPGQCSAGSPTPGSRCNVDGDCGGGTCLGDDVKPSPDPFKPPFELVGSGPAADVVVNCP
jgi:hypothetical protein